MLRGMSRLEIVLVAKVMLKMTRTGVVLIARCSRAIWFWETVSDEHKLTKLSRRLLSRKTIFSDRITRRFYGICLLHMFLSSVERSWFSLYLIRFQNTVEIGLTKSKTYALTLCFENLRTGVPNLSLTMYPFSIPTDEHVPLQYFKS